LALVGACRGGEGAYPCACGGGGGGGGDEGRGARAVGAGGGGERGDGAALLFFEEDPELHMPVCEAAPSVFVGVGLDGGEVVVVVDASWCVLWKWKFKISPA
jgi:hypothetical protein